MIAKEVSRAMPDNYKQATHGVVQDGDLVWHEDKFVEAGKTNVAALGQPRANYAFIAVPIGRRRLDGPKIERLKDELFEALLALHDHEYTGYERTLIALLIEERESKKS